MIGELPYPIYSRLSRFYIWWGRVWCALRNHRLHTATMYGTPGVACKPCDRWEAVGVEEGKS